MKTKRLRETDHEAISEVLKFLNYPSWRDKISSLTSECIMLFKDEINLLKVSTFLTVFDVS